MRFPQWGSNALRNIMQEHQFSLVVAGHLDNDSTLDALFETGCDDAALALRQSSDSLSSAEHEIVTSLIRAA